MTLRKYIPEVGHTVKMREFMDYTSRGIHVWAHLKVIAINGETVSFQVLNGAEETNLFSACPLSAIQPPLGWEPVYTIYCKPEQAEKIVSDWFTRGIVVRANHCIGDSAGSTFQPMDNSPQPHWKYTEVTDAIPAEQCAKTFRVVSVVEEEITSATLGYPADPNCDMCQGTGRRTLAHLANVRKETVEETRSLIESGKISLDDTLVNDTFRCHCHWGAVSRLGRSKRVKLFKDMEKNGWIITRVPYAGGFWVRRRETVIHEV